VLEELRSEMGSADFAAQYLQEPVPPSGNLLNWSWFQVYDTPPQWMQGDSVIVSIDTAMSASELADFSAAVVLHIRGDSAYVLDVVCLRLEYPDLRRKMIELHRHWSRMPARYCLLIEDKGSGTSLIQDLKRENVHAISIKPEGEKILRMHKHTARIEAGSVFVCRARRRGSISFAPNSWRFHWAVMTTRSMRCRRAWSTPSPSVPKLGSDPSWASTSSLARRLPFPRAKPAMAHRLCRP
jgi:predicted phage terminase large subunit-like protein